MQNRQIIQDASRVQALGDEIGYGHLMELASALWRKRLREKGYPTSGAFVPTVTVLLTKEGKEIANESCDLYDSLIAN